MYFDDRTSCTQDTRTHSGAPPARYRAEQRATGNSTNTQRELGGSHFLGVVSNSWYYCVFTLNSSHVRTLMLADVQTPFLGTPLAPLKNTSSCNIVAIFYPFSQFCEISISLLSLQTQPNIAPNLFQRGVEYGKYATGTGSQTNLRAARPKC